MGKGNIKFTALMRQVPALQLTKYFFNYLRVQCQFVKEAEVEEPPQLLGVFGQLVRRSRFEAFLRIPMSQIIPIIDDLLGEIGKGKFDLI